MKVLLVSPPSNPQSYGMEKFFLIEPLALEYIGAGIRDNHEVKLLDLRVPGQPGLKETLEAFQPDIIGSGGFTIDVCTIKELFVEAKKILPQVLTVVGGHHATMMPTDFFDRHIDVVVSGEGVFPFRRLCDYHEKHKSFEDIDGIYYRKDGAGEEMVFTRKAEFPPLDTLPFPDRALTAQWRDKYVYPLMFEPGKISYLATIRGSTGCIYRCNFCSISRMFDHQVYQRSIDNIMAELVTIKEPVVYWVDDEFLLDPQQALLLAKEIQKAGIKKTFWFYGRVDRIVQHSECIEEWAKIGLRVVLVGLESHKEEDLKRMRKGTSLSKNEEALRICHANNVQVRGNFIVQPDFDRKDFKDIAVYSRKLDVDLPGFSILTPFPGTDLYEEVKDQLIAHNHNFFDMGHTLLPTKLPLKQFYKEFSRIFIRGTSLKRKIKLYKQIHPQFRKVYSSGISEMPRKLRNTYLEY